jgi:magnesium transporter
LKPGPKAARPPRCASANWLKIRSRDVLEHIERVVHHVSRMEQSAETAVQMHFSAQSNRTNDIMRTLTALTAIFLPLNLITGFFGMNFEFMPFHHASTGFWWTFGVMVLICRGGRHGVLAQAVPGQHAPLTRLPPMFSQAAAAISRPC